MYHHTQSDPLATESFPTDPSGLPEAGRPRLLELAPGDTLELQVGPVAKRLGDPRCGCWATTAPFLAPRSRSSRARRSSSTSSTRVTWTPPCTGTGCGWRTATTACPRDPGPRWGGEFTYRIQFPDAGLYWYHPHIREDYTQELGLYANILVVPPSRLLAPVDRDVILTVDDLLVEEGRIAPFSPVRDQLCGHGTLRQRLFDQRGARSAAAGGEVVRLWLTNTANTRVFNLAVPEARMKLVGGDSGRVEHQELVDSVVVAPSERAVVDVLVGGRASCTWSITPPTGPTRWPP